MDIFVVSVENGETVNLTRTPDISEELPRWSPDGNFSPMLVEAIRQRGGVVEYDCYEDEGHSLRAESGIDRFERTVAFLNEYVK